MLGAPKARNLYGDITQDAHNSVVSSSYGCGEIGGLPHWGVALLVVLDKRIADDEFRQRDPSGNTVL